MDAKKTKQQTNETLTPRRRRRRRRQQPRTDQTAGSRVVSWKNKTLASVNRDSLRRAFRTNIEASGGGESWPSYGREEEEREAEQRAGPRYIYGGLPCGRGGPICRAGTGTGPQQKSQQPLKALPRVYLPARSTHSPPVWLPTVHHLFHTFKTTEKAKPPDRVSWCNGMGLGPVKSDSHG